MTNAWNWANCRPSFGAARRYDAGSINRDYEMLQFCMFGGHSGTIRPDRAKLYVTLFGSCELRLATMAQLAVANRQRRDVDPGIAYATRRQPFFLTIFGGTEISRPTLVEEYLELQEVLRSGLLDTRSWESEVREAALNFSSQIGSFTLFGSFEPSKLPTENEELDRLALSHNLGQLGDLPRKLLLLAIGQDGVQRVSAVCQAVAIGSAESRS